VGTRFYRSLAACGAGVFILTANVALASTPIDAKLNLNRSGLIIEGELRFDREGGDLYGTVHLDVATHPENLLKRQDGGTAAGRFKVQLTFQGSYTAGPSGALTGEALLSGTFVDRANCQAKMGGTGVFNGYARIALGAAEIAAEWEGADFQGCGLQSPQPFSALLPPFTFRPKESIPPSGTVAAAATAREPNNTFGPFAGPLGDTNSQELPPKEPGEIDSDGKVYPVSGEFSTALGTITFHRSGSPVAVYKPTQQGRFLGTYSGPVFAGYWVSKNSAKLCSVKKDGSLHWGPIRLVFDANFNEFKGKWGHCDGAPKWQWNGKRISSGGSQLASPPSSIEPTVEAVAHPVPAKTASDRDLIEAADKGDLQAVQSALQRGANPNAGLEETGKNALALAASDGHREMVVLLLDAGANPNLQALLLGQFPLYLAALEGQVEIIRLLHERGADVNFQGVKTVKYFSNTTALHGAVYKNQVLAVQTLLSVGGDPFLEDTRGDTPLHQAAHEGKFEVFHTFLEENVSINRKDSKGFTPFMSAAFSDYKTWPLLAVILEQGMDVNARIQAHPKVFKKAHGATALMGATGNQNVDNILFLLLAGADPTLKNDLGQTALDIAIFEFGESSSSVPVQKILAALGHPQKGIQIARKHFTKQLFNSLRLGQPKEIALLLNVGLSANSRNDEGKSLLMEAVTRNNPEIVTLLLGKGADVSIIDANGETPLDVAGSQGKPRIVDLLLEAGADPSTRP